MMMKMMKMMVMGGWCHGECAALGGENELTQRRFERKRKAVQHPK